MKEALNKIKNATTLVTFIPACLEALTFINNDKWQQCSASSYKENPKLFFEKFNKDAAYVNSAIEVTRASSKCSDQAYDLWEINKKLPPETIQAYRDLQKTIKEWVNKNNKLFTKNEMPTIQEVLPKQDEYMKLYDVKNATRPTSKPAPTPSITTLLQMYGFNKEQTKQYIEELKLKKFEEEIKERP